MEITNKLWNLCNTLRHDGVDSSDYVEQITYLLFLKLAELRDIEIPEECSWSIFRGVEDDKLPEHLDYILSELQKQKGILGDIFAEPISRIRKTSSIRKMIVLLDSIDWSSYKDDIIGLAFEELLGKVANDGKKGAGQYFTPRPLIQAIVSAVQPNPLESKNTTICDVACGTSGFLLFAYEWFKEQAKSKKISVADKKRVTTQTYFGQELVARPRRLALMNMFLRGIEAKIKLGDSIYDKPDNKLFSVIITNPPFGTKGSNQIPNRDDFTVETSDKQLNFIQHVYSVLEKDGRAAIVLPDSVLSDKKAVRIWEYLSDKCNIHTILKLPNGTFAAYAQGVKACVVFLQKGVPTTNIWIFDARTDINNVTKTSRPLSEKHFAEFLKSYGIDPNGKAKREENDRFKKFTIKQIKENGFHLDFSWEQAKEDYLPRTKEELETFFDDLKQDFLNMAAKVDDLRSIISK